MIIEDSLDGINMFCERKEEFLFIQSEEISSLLANIDELESIELDITISEEELDEFKEAFLELIDCFHRFNPQEVEKFKKEFEIVLKSGIVEAVLKEKDIYRLVTDFMYIDCSLFYLSLIMTPHAVVTRYPIRDFNPLEEYTKELPLVQAFDELTEIMQKTLSKMENYIKLTKKDGNTDDIPRKSCSRELHY